MPAEGAEVLSPELCLVDPELAGQARLALTLAAELPLRRRWTRTRRLVQRSLSVAVALSGWLLLVHPQTVADSTTLGPPAEPTAVPRPPSLHASRPARPPLAGTAGRWAPRPRMRRPAAAPATTPIRPHQVLNWPSVSAATFYDVILWRDGRRVLDLWPTAARVVLPERWSFHGKRFTLADGPYQWFVYPASGTRSSARYGRLAARGTVAKRPAN